MITSVEEPASDGAPPADFSVSPNYPNPFNPVTVIRYAMTEPCRVTAEVFDVKGDRMAVLTDARMPAGRHSIRWDGTDLSGHAVSGGVYFCRIHAGKLQQTVRMLLLR